MDSNVDLAAIQRQKERREAEPLFICKVITKWPIKSFLLTLSLHVLMVVITGILVAADYDIFPVHFDNMPFRITHEPWDARHYAWTNRDQYADRYQRSGRNSGFRTSRERISSLDLVYNAGSGNNVFTKEAFAQMQRLENELFTAKDFDKYCQIDPVTKACALPISIIRYFDGSMANVNSVFNDTSFDNIVAVLNEAFTNNATAQQFRYFLCKEYTITASAAVCSITRSILPFGKPHEDFDTAEEYEKHIQEYSGEHLKPILEKYVESSQWFSLFYRSEALWGYDTTLQSKKDVIYINGSTSFIFILILIHTRSFWIAALAILSIFTSFVTGNLIYNLVYGYQYLGTFQVLAIFIILGIGADDIFVFYDIWRNSAADEYPSLAHRLSDVYRRSAISMLFTSLTTSVAFFSSAIVPLLATRSFGLFAATVVTVNYLSVILYFPTVIIMYHLYIKDIAWPCYAPCRLVKKKCCKSSAIYNTKQTNTKQATPPGTIIKSTDVFRPSHTAHYDNHACDAVELPDIEKQYQPNNSPRIGHSNGHSEQCHTNVAYIPDPSESSSNKGVQEHKFRSMDSKITVENSTKTLQTTENKSAVNRFFTNYYFRFVTHRYFRWLMLLNIAAILGFFLYQATQLNIYADKAVSVFPDDHNYPMALDFKLHAFTDSETDENTEVVLVFGMKENDLSGCKFSQPVCEGERQWDNSFNPNSVDAQLALKKLCHTLRTMSSHMAYELRMRTNPVTGEYDIKCFMDNLGTFLEEESANTGKNWSLPFTRDKLMSFMDDRATYYNSSALNSAEYDDIIEVPLSYWLYDRYSGTYNQDYLDYDALLGESISEFSTPLKTDSDILYGNKMKYVAIQVELSVNYKTLSYKEGIPVRTSWEEFFTAQLKDMPAGPREGFQMSSPEVWASLTRKKMIVNNALYGIVIGVSLACPILIVATSNVITGLLASLSLCCCITCVIGVIPLGGMSLGVIEGLNLCMIVGLSVDYVVHLAEGYSHSLHQDRLSRVRDMLDEMAVPIFFGACTTLGASSFLFLTKITFFQQFGMFMFSTLGFSFVFSMGLFVVLLGMIGPEKDTGNFVVFCKRKYRQYYT